MRAAAAAFDGDGGLERNADWNRFDSIDFHGHL